MKLESKAVEFASWDRVGGDGAIRNGDGPDTLVIRQPESIQRQTSQLLANWRAARQQ